jgi:hypothetical protein
MAKIVERTAHVEAAPETVWGLLINLNSWNAWWPECVEANTDDTRTLREGSKIELVIEPRHRKITLSPFVDMMSEGRSLSLTLLSPLLKGTVVWTVADGPSGAKVSVRGVFTGFQVWLLGLVGGTLVFQTSLYANLRGLKKFAEKMV